MKWGKRKASADVEKATVTVNGTDHDAGPVRASADALTSAGYKSRVAVGGVNALSTKELQTLVTRQNLEQQYAKLNPEPISAGQKFMTETLPTLVSVAGTAKTAYDVFYPAKEPPPPSTDLRVVSGKQKAGDMVLHLGKQLVKEHGMTVGKMALEAMLSK
ncbi:hypothetical protein QCN36_gp07 [Arthrobacter phage CastorTray]|uniref:Uncharacterized protein n=1 Tax=Arthrobacter phage CastorTray TaxID=2859632 RepID=A0AAE7WDD1_9CAUD|nr:hypothetical protein QCN36_gp07 [Arthrobacter phage CastorTray]QYC54995.1 hypothetical protein SEA_CASTORTRAY_7 [Arthrobacter phage CastorTray]